MLEWTIELPDAAAAVGSPWLRGYRATTDQGVGVSTRDPWGTAVRLRVSDDVGWPHQVPRGSS